MNPQDLIAKALDQMLSETSLYYINLSAEPPEEEMEWAKALITSRIESLDLRPNESELYELMQLKMKV
jgi:hypothetical protein